MQGDVPQELKAPRHPKGSTDRALELEQAMETAFSRGVERWVAVAVAAGWSEDEAEVAILSLAQNRAWARVANEKTEAAIDEVWQVMGEKTEH